MDKKSYAIGLGIGQNLLGMGAKDIVVADFAQAVSDLLEGRKPAIDHKEAQIIVNQYLNELQERVNSFNQKAGAEFLASNGQKEGVVTLPSGLQYQVLKSGEGTQHPTLTDKVECHYEGTLIDGTLFDSSIRRGQPATFGVNQVIAGWTEALQLMTPGDKWKLFIPYNLAYGEQGAGNGAIQPYSTLIFEVELLKIIN